MALTVADLKLRLNKTTTTDDAELQAMLDAAIAFYAQTVGPTATKTLKFDGAGVIVLPVTATSVTAASYSNGTTVPVTDLDFDADTGLLRYPFTRGYRNVSVTFTVAVPAHHQEIILADAAGYFAATQRGNSPSALPSVGYESGFEDRSTPVVLFPRIKALATAGVA